MIQIVNNHFKSLLNNLLIKAYNKKPISINNNIFRWDCIEINKKHNIYDIIIGQPIEEENVDFGIPYKLDLTKEQEFLINKIFEKWGNN